jgi:hypothetical protein
VTRQIKRRTVRLLNGRKHGSLLGLALPSLFIHDWPADPEGVEAELDRATLASMAAPLARFEPSGDLCSSNRAPSF